MEEGLHRDCVHCGADTWFMPGGHRNSCPEKTGLWPIEQYMLTTGAVCFHCCELFRDDDYYMTVGPNNEVTCVGCAAAIELLGA